MSIALDTVSYTYAPGTPYVSEALKNISITIEKGEFVGIMGKTGCGKSTLIQLIAGLLAPESGTILLDGKDINDKKYDRNELRRKIGVVFQFPECQLFETTVERDVAFGLKHFGWSKEKMQSAVEHALTIMGFDYEKVREKSPLEFSGGEKRRIAIAGILAAEPEVLILDEPIAGRDPLGREAFLSLVKQLNASGMTILMVSHNADALAECAERIVVLKDGRLLKDGSAREVFFAMKELQQNGIGVSEARQCAGLLAERGFDIAEDTICYEDLLKQLIVIGRRQKR